VATAVAQLFGSAVFSTEGESLEEVVGKLLRERNDTVAVAESCTAGMVAKRITDVAGASAYFLGGIVCYDNRIKRDLVGVKEETLASYGAVSKETAVELAQGVRARCNSDWAVAVTGIAGPEGGTPEKPVGLVYIAIAGANRCTSIERRFGGDRDRIRKWTAQVALDQLRIALLQAANRHAVR
jgi:nicotinamide-nucleotide amidase